LGREGLEMLEVCSLPTCNVGESTSRGKAGRGRSRLPLSREPNVGLDPRTLGS